jgi:UDP-N-acetylglucosamine transferase subunit ALG13
LNKNENILICPLDWGLGHATRMLPLARILRDYNKNIFVAGSEEHLSLFRNELPGLSYIKFPGFKPVYSRLLPQYISLLFRTPLLLYHIAREHYKLKKIITDYNINIVISDNRFGLWNKNIKTVYVTHMPLIPLPKALRALEFIGVMFHRYIIEKYSYCFIPDLPGDQNVSGRLSHGLDIPDNVRFIGILSRFMSDSQSLAEKNTEKVQNTIILSGPEPQRGILKKKLVDLLKNNESQIVIFEGKPGADVRVVTSDNITIFNHLPTKEMRDIILNSKNIISRSGYTTIMDLISLNCSALLIPTPGQTEQEYLAEYLSKKDWFSTLKQKKLKTGTIISSKGKINYGEITTQSNILLKNALNELLEEIHI